MREPFDQELYEAVMAEGWSHAETPYEYGYIKGFEDAAKRAARIAAERAPVSDEELVRAWNDAYSDAVDGFCDPESDPDCVFLGTVAGIRAVRSALMPGPAVPVSDEALAAQIEELIGSHTDGTDWEFDEGMGASVVRAVRAVLTGTAVPVIPDGWRWYSLHELDTGEIVAMLQRRDHPAPNTVYGKATDWIAALNAAIAAAEVKP